MCISYRESAEHLLAPAHMAPSGSCRFQFRASDATASLSARVIDGAFNFPPDPSSSNRLLDVVLKI